MATKFKRIKDRLPPEIKGWRPSEALINAFELCFNTFGGDCDEDRATVCRKALNLCSVKPFSYAFTDKKLESKNRLKGEKAHNSINLEINHNIFYLEKKLGVKLLDSEIEGIVIAWIMNKVKNKPVRKKTEYTFDYSY